MLERISFLSRKDVAALADSLEGRIRSAGIVFVRKECKNSKEKGIRRGAEKRSFKFWSTQRGIKDKVNVSPKSQKRGILTYLAIAKCMTPLTVVALGTK